jgi:hypothetical protein
VEKVAADDPAAVFWVRFLQAEVKEQFITLPDAIKNFGSKNNGSGMFVRSCYDSLLTVMDGYEKKKQRDAFQIEGNPGIGKTNFAMYAARHFAKAGADVVFESIHMSELFLLKPDGTVFRGSRQSFRDAFNDSRVTYIVDGVPPFLQAQGRVILVTTPK